MYGFLLAILSITVIMVGISLSAFYLYCNYLLFEKCNVDGWKGLIPFYNTYIKIRLAGLKLWYLILFISAVILLIDSSTGLKLLCVLIILFVSSLISYNFTKRMKNGKTKHVVDFMLLTFVPIIYLPVLVFNDEYTFDNTVEVTPNAYIDKIQTSDFDIYKKEEKTCKKCGTRISETDKYCPECGKKQ